MRKLVLDTEDCTCCGKCEKFLPGAIDRLEESPILFNTKNPNVNFKAIKGAVESCPISALSVCDLDGNLMSFA